MKDKIKTAILFLATSLIFSACEKTPERESSSVAGEETYIEQEIQKYKTLEEVRNEVLQLEGKNYLNLSLPESIIITEENTVRDYSAHRIQEKEWNAFNPLVEKIWDDYSLMDFDNDYYIKSYNDSKKDYLYDAREFYHKEKPDNEYKLAIENDDKNFIINNYDLYYSSTTWGYFGGGSKEIYPLNLDKAGFKKVVEYRLLWDDVPDDTEYQLEDGKMNIKDAIDLVENRCNMAFEEFDGGMFKHKVAYVAVYKFNDTEKYVFDIITNRYIDGIPLDPCCSFWNNTAKDWGKAISGRGMLYFRIDKKDRISYFVDHYEAFELGESTEQNQIISFNYAIESIKDQIATVGIDKIQQCGLVYLFSSDTFWDGSTKSYSGFSFGQINNSDIENSIRMRPYWLFAIKGKNMAHSASILVDALDGTVYYFDYSG